MSILLEESPAIIVWLANPSGLIHAVGEDIPKNLKYMYFKIS